MFLASWPLYLNTTASKFINLHPCLVIYLLDVICLLLNSSHYYRIRTLAIYSYFAFSGCGCIMFGLVGPIFTPGGCVCINYICRDS